MMTIEIDFEAYKALTARRSSEQVTYNDVIRDLLNLKPVKSDKSMVNQATSDGWVAKGVHFPTGTEFQARYKGKVYRGKAEDGYLALEDGSRFSSPSAAAGKITGNFVNGWNFWECRLPGETRWRIINSMRNDHTR